jgi:hypothetical protein
LGLLGGGVSEAVERVKVHFDDLVALFTLDTKQRFEGKR